MGIGYSAPGPTPVLASERGQPGGVATLDANGDLVPGQRQDPEHFPVTVNTSFSNLGAGRSFFFAHSGIADLTNFAEVACFFNRAGSLFAGSFVVVEWSADSFATVGGDLVPPFVIPGPVGYYRTPFNAIPAGALGQIIAWRFGLGGGDGVADPFIGCAGITLR